MSIIDTSLPGSINLSAISSPDDIRPLTIEQLESLADALRAPLIARLAAHGGHAGPNLGFLEATIALHYVFNAPVDKIVFDVSHQTYVHKMLTGRIDAFINPERYGEVTGYTNPGESPYDIFALGHTSTSVSLATGLAKARDIKGTHENVIAVIGDGSLSGGEAFEGLDYAATLKSNFIVIVNDNQMSIAPNHGGIYENLSLLRQTNGTADCNLFRAMGFRYLYVGYGNDLRSLVKAFSEVKDSDTPIVVHINTTKGHGLPVAEKQKEAFHFSAPFNPKTGALSTPANPDNYIDIFTSHMLDRMANNPGLCVLTAGTPGAIGFYPDRREAAGSRFIDVGIAEEQAVAMASGLANAGCNPVFGVCGTFLQRAYDQLSQDLSINRNPATLVTFDVPMISNIPGILFLAPTNVEEYLAMLDWAITQRVTPVVVRTPSGKVVHAEGEVEKDYANAGYLTVEQGRGIAIIAAGDFFTIGRQAAGIMRGRGLNPTLINPRVISHLDTDTLDNLRDYQAVITLEDNTLDGGLGQKIAADLSGSAVTVHTLGLPKAFPDRYKASDLLASCGLTPEAIASLV